MPGGTLLGRTYCLVAILCFFPQSRGQVCLPSASSWLWQKLGCSSNVVVSISSCVFG